MKKGQAWLTQINEPGTITPITAAFLSRLTAELDEESVTAIILTGSCARGEETAFSDVDLKCFVKQTPAGAGHRRYWREGRLISVTTDTLERFRKRLRMPEEALFVVPGLREARILLDKDGAFQALQQEAKDWTWEPLQEAANSYVSNLLIEYAEWILKLLRAFFVHDVYALSEMTLGVFSAATLAVVVQKGVLATSGNSYFRQAQEAAGWHSHWSHYHRLIAGIDGEMGQEASAEARGIAALRLYQETVQLLRPALHAEQRDVLEQTIAVIEHALSGEDIT